MIKIERAVVMNLEGAIRGARNPMNSWAMSDSYYNSQGEFVLGPKDLDLAVRLCKAGSDHRKFMRQIMVCMDVTAPLYWWKEYDTYKVATTANSTSTMHKIHAKPIEASDFSVEHLSPESMVTFKAFIGHIENLRIEFNETKDKGTWYEIIQLLPSSYNQMRTLTLNYENLISMYYARKDHKQDEWRMFCRWIETLPYANPLIFSPDA